jgi:hypothetical protein
MASPYPMFPTFLSLPDLPQASLELGTLSLGWSCRFTEGPVNMGTCAKLVAALLAPS